MKPRKNCIQFKGKNSCWYRWQQGSFWIGFTKLNQKNAKN